MKTQHENAIESQDEGQNFVSKVAVSIFGKGTRTYYDGHGVQGDVRYKVYLRNIHTFADVQTFTKFVTIHMIHGAAPENNSILSMERVALIVSLKSD